MPDSGLAQTDRPRMGELLDIAAGLFNKKGYKATSLAEIGDALGMNKASLYYYVESKDDLLAHVIYRASQRLRVLAEAIAENRDDPATALIRLVRTHCNTILDHPDEFGTVIFQRRHIAATVLPEIAERERVYFDAVKDLVARGIDKGAFRHMDAGVAAQMLLDTMNGVLRWYRPGGRLSRQAAIDEIVGLATNALARAGE